MSLTKKVKYKGKYKNERGKKILSFFLALLLLGVGAFSLKGCVNNKKDNSIDTTVETQVEDEMLLGEDFDINNADEVKKRAEEILKIVQKDNLDVSDKKFTLDEIIALIYYYNGAFDNIDYSDCKNDVQKYQKLQELTISLEQLLNDNIQDDVGVLSGDREKVDEDTEIFGYMLKAKTDDGKKLEKDFAKLVNKQLENIKKGTVDYNVVKDYILFYENAMKTFKTNKSITSEDKVLLTKDIKAKNPLFTTYMVYSGNYEAFGYTKEEYDAKIKELDQNIVNFTNELGNKAVEHLGLIVDVDSLIDSYKKTTVPTGSRYNSDDAAAANQRIGNPSGSDVDATNVVDEGGKNKRTVTVSNEPTTTKVKETEKATDEFKDAVEDIKDDLTQKGKDPNVDVTIINDNDDEFSYEIDEKPGTMDNYIIVYQDDVQDEYVTSNDVVEKGGVKVN